MLTNKFIRIIKIENKTFEDLTLAEIALMIDADTSISPHGNDYFSSSALDIFLHNTVDRIYII